MNYTLPFIPERTSQPREKGLTMVMDKGLSLKEAENLINSSGYFIDILKLGFGTSMLAPDLKKKVSLYKEAGLRTYVGGTLFEAFIIRDMFDDFRKYLDKYGFEFAEISDGSINLPLFKKLDYIRKLSEQLTVVSEVGSKSADVVIPDDVWVANMKAELEAGSWKVIAEARESGTIGIYNKDGSANLSLIDDIIDHIDIENVIWEAPNENQQAWFIKLLGANVNLGNIAPSEVIALETLRVGLRGDTFSHFLPDQLKQAENL